MENEEIVKEGIVAGFTFDPIDTSNMNIAQKSEYYFGMGLGVVCGLILIEGMMSGLFKVTQEYSAAPLYKFGINNISLEKNIFLSLNLENPRVRKMKEILQSFLEQDYKVKINKKGDPVFIDKENKKRIRFDAKYSHGDKPHGHVEIRKDDEWVDYTDQHQIYLNLKHELELAPTNKR